MICSPGDVPLWFFLSSLFPPSGEIGIVERSTGDEGLASPFASTEAVAAAIVPLV